MDPIEPLDDDARELLATYRGERPGPHGRARNWPAVRSRITAEPRTVVRPRSSLWIGGVAFALAAAILLLVRAVFGAWQALQIQQATPPAASDVVDVPAAVEAPAVREPIVPLSPARPAAAPSAPPIPEVVPLQRPLSTKPTPPPRGKDTAREETELVGGARDSIAEEDWAAALATLDEHARRFADGVLAEERSALRAIALCRSGDESARAAVLVFNSRYPGSHHHRSIELACDQRSNRASP